MDTALCAIFCVKCPPFSGPVKILKLQGQGLRELYENHKKLMSLCQAWIIFMASKQDPIPPDEQSLMPERDGPFFVNQVASREELGMSVNADDRFRRHIR